MMKKIAQSKNKILTACIICSLAVVLNACHSTNNDNKPIEAGDIQGLWERTGYGDLLRVEGETAEDFEFTRNTCIKVADIDSVELNKIVATIKLADDKKSITRITSNEAFPDTFNKVDQLPESCKPENIITESTPTTTFDILWNTFNDYYAFFEERNVNWQEQGVIFRPHVNNNMNDEELFELLSNLLEPIDDDHVSLIADTEDMQDKYSPASTIDYLDELIAEFQGQTDPDDLLDLIAEKVRETRELPLQFVSDIKQAGVVLDSEIGEAPAVIWGKIGDDIGYINFTRMDSLGETLDSINDGILDSNLDGNVIDDIMDRIMADLKDTRAMVIDVRFNAGGYDLVSLKIASRFATQRQQVLTKFARSYSGSTPQLHAYLEPSAAPYIKPVAVLSSQYTVSAGEIFLMAINALPNTTLIGEASSGALSSILGKTLPNEWEFELSNEVNIDFQGRRLEASGVPVDIHVKAFSVADLKSSTDTALETALSSVGATLPVQ